MAWCMADACAPGGVVAWNAAKADGNWSGKKPPLPVVPGPTDSRSGIIHKLSSTSFSSTNYHCIQVSSFNIFIVLLHTLRHNNRLRLIFGKSSNARIIFSFCTCNKDMIKFNYINLAFNSAAAFKLLNYCFFYIQSKLKKFNMFVLSLRARASLGQLAVITSSFLRVSWNLLTKLTKRLLFQLDRITTANKI